MPKKKKFGRTPTSNYSSYMGDSRKAFDFTMNRVYDMLEEYTYHKEQNIFQAVVLSGLSVGGTAVHSAVVNSVNSGSIKTILLKIRFYEIDEVFNYVTDPRLAESAGEIRFLIDAHPDAILEIPSNQNYIPPPGAVLKIEKIGMTYYVREVLSDTSDYILTPTRSLTGGAKKIFNGSRPSLNNFLASFTGEKSKGKELKDAPNLSWTTLKALAEEGVFTEILKEIAIYESGKAGYNAWNYDGGNKMGNSQLMISVFGKDLSELTIKQVATETQVNNSFGGASAFAVGKYQMIPRTLKSAIETIAGCNLSETFGPIQQEAFGIYLLTMKRPILGKYLTGDTSITVESAQLAMAKEWAGVRLIAPTYRNTYKPYMQLSAGNSYYAGVGANPGVTDINLSRAQSTYQVLLQAQSSIRGNPKLKEILETNEAMRARQKKFEQAEQLYQKGKESVSTAVDFYAKKLGLKKE